MIFSAFTEQYWAIFVRRLHYIALNGSKQNDYAVLRDFLDDSDSAPSRASVTSTDQTLNASTVRVFYLTTDPGLFGPISENLGQADLVTPESRVVLEKPIGHDLASSRAVNDAVGAVFGENQIFRIDHYLGKEAVQNLLALRFANALFEPVWNARGGHVRQASVDSGCS